MLEFSIRIRVPFARYNRAYRFQHLSMFNQGLRMNSSVKVSFFALCILVMPSVLANQNLGQREAVALLAENGRACGELLERHVYALAGDIPSPSSFDRYHSGGDGDSQESYGSNLPIASSVESFLAHEAGPARARARKAAQLAKVRIDAVEAEGDYALVGKLRALYGLQEEICRAASEPFPYADQRQELREKGERLQEKLQTALGQMPSVLRTKDGHERRLLLFSFQKELQRAADSGVGDVLPRVEVIPAEELRARKEEIARRNAWEEEQRRAAQEAERDAELAQRARAEEIANRPLPKFQVRADALEKREIALNIPNGPNPSPTEMAAMEQWHPAYQRGILPFKRVLGLLFSVDRRRITNPQVKQAFVRVMEEADICLKGEVLHSPDPVVAEALGAMLQNFRDSADHALMGRREPANSSFASGEAKLKELATRLQWFGLTP
jgi:hypothetical protein